MRDVTLAYQQISSKITFSNLKSSPWLFHQTTCALKISWKITPNKHLPNFLLFMAIPMKTNLFSFTSTQLHQYSYNLLSFTIKSRFNLCKSLPRKTSRPLQTYKPWPFTPNQPQLPPPTDPPDSNDRRHQQSARLDPNVVWLLLSHLPKGWGTPLKINGWNIIPWRFGSDHFPFFSWVMAVGSMLIFQGWYCWWFRNPATYPPGMQKEPCKIMGKQLPTSTGDRRISEPSTVGRTNPWGFG